jgi:hypothetical protein
VCMLLFLAFSLFLPSVFFVEADVLINPFFVVGVVSCPLSGAVIKPILPPTLGARGHVSRMTILAHTALSGLRGATR